MQGASVRTKAASARVAGPAGQSTWWLWLAVAGAVAMLAAGVLPDARADVPFDAVGQWGGPTRCVAADGDRVYFGVGHRVVVLDVSDPDNAIALGESALLEYLVSDVVAVGTYAYVTNGWYGLVVLDVSDPAAITVVGTAGATGYAQGLSVAGDYAYVAGSSDGLRIIDISTPSAPLETGSFDTPGEARQVKIVGALAYIADGPAGLQIVDVSDPAAPIFVGGLALADEASDVAVVGDYAYVADGYYHGFVVVDVTDPTNPVEAGFCGTDGSPGGVAVAGNYAYVGNAWGGLAVIDVSNPQAPAMVAAADTDGWSREVVLLNDRAYLADYSTGLQVFDVSTPLAPAWTSEYRRTTGETSDVAVAGTLVYLTDGSFGGGMQVMDVSSPATPERVGSMYSNEYAWGLTQAGDYVYLADGCAGFSVVDVADPYAPQRLAELATGCAARDAAVQGDYVYVADDNQSLLIVDVSDPYVPVLMGQWHDDLNPGYALGVAVSGNLVYLANGNAGLEIIDVADPTDPQRIGHYTGDGNPMDVALSGGYAYVAADWGSLEIVDVSDPQNPFRVGVCNELGPAQGVAVVGSYAYVAAWDWGVWIVDVSNPAAPLWIANYNTVGGARRVAVADNYVYVADGDNGLQVLARGDFVWANADGGNFGEATNWTPAGPPGASAEATFNLPYEYAVAFDADYTHARARVYDGRVSLDLGGFTYGLTDEFSLFVGVLPDRSATLAVSDGTLSARYAGLADRLGSAGRLELSGAGSLFQVDPSYGYFDVGIDGAGEVAIADGAVASSLVTKLALWGESSGHITVTGTDAQLAVADLLLVGERGDAELLVQNGGVVHAGFAVVGEKYEEGGAIVGYGEVRVENPDSRFDVDHEILLGMNGEGVLRISDYAEATSGWQTQIGVQSTGRGTLFIDTGGRLTTSGFGSLAQEPDSYGEVTVTDYDSQWLLAGPGSDLHVGLSGQGILTIAQGATLTVNNSWSFVGTYAGAWGTMTVTDPDSVYTNDVGPVTVGGDGIGTIQVLNGGLVNLTDGELWIGNTSGSEGYVNVEGDGSNLLEISWYSSEVGCSGYGELNVLDGGYVSLVSTLVGAYPVGAGFVSVWDGGSRFETEFLSVGREGGGTLLIGNGGTVSVVQGALAGEAVGAVGYVEVSGPDSLWEITGVDNFLKIGEWGTGMLMVSGGGVVTNEIGTLAAYEGSFGEATITGPGSRWTNNNNLIVGREDLGTLLVSDEGTVETPSLSFVGELPGSEGMVTITGAGSQWLADGGQLDIGAAGIGTLNILDGGTVTAGGILTAMWAGSTGDLVITGTDSTLHSASGVLAGREGTGSVVVELGGVLTTGGWLGIAEQPGALGYATIWDGGYAEVNGVVLGRWSGAEGHLLVTDPDVTLTSLRQIQVGYEGQGDMQIMNGADVVSYKGTSATGTSGIIGMSAGAQGVATVSGVSSQWTQDGALNVGWLGEGTLTVEDAALLESAVGIIARSPGSVGYATVTDAGARWIVGESMNIGGTPTEVGGTGSLTVGAESVVTVGQTLRLWENGTLTLDTGKLTVGTGPLPAGSGMLAVYPDGTLTGCGTITGQAFHLGGTVAPGCSTGTLTVTGDYTQDEAAGLEVELRGLAAGTEYDRLAVSGIATLAGTLRISLLDDFVPQVGDTFEVVAAGSVAGQFAAVEGLCLDAQRKFAIEYTSTAVTLTVVARFAGDGDFDCDSDVDLDDYGVFAGCLAGPDVLPSPPLPTTAQECLDVFDHESDGDVDLADWAQFAGSFTSGS
ncbi:MAG TPA: hypothetical protein PKK06_10860 [Phycisphaerae bacterium]|nr:hypothetical protein [Phycisphaerae bacterium]HNU44316.1 hypothetical protein [Phycisphaerae bacterium]